MQAPLARQGRRARHAERLAFALVACVFATSPAFAQRTGEGFLFGAPKGGVTVRGGFDQASAGSDLFTFFIDELTLNHRDFGAASIGADVQFRITPHIPRLYGVAGIAFSHSKNASEFRHWLDNFDLPIQQTTEFKRVPITVGAKMYLTPPGRQIGRLAWVPARTAVFAGGAVGAVYYRMHQSGDFIDFNTLRVFPDVFHSVGARPTVHGFGGVDMTIRPRVVLTTELRYEWARAKLGRDFLGFEPADLSGVSFTMGVTFRY